MDVVRKIESNKTDGRDKPVKEVILTLSFPVDPDLHSISWSAGNLSSYGFYLLNVFYACLEHLLKIGHEISLFFFALS
jgi:hypothetical protein